MQSKTVPELFSLLKENVLRVGEKKHLTAMKKRSEIREHEPHSDLLSRMQESPHVTSHQKCIEHQGLNFWTFYFENEKPHLDDPLPDYLNQAWDENLRIQARTIAPPLTKVIPAIDGVGETDDTIATHWARAFTLAEAAAAAGDLEVAESGFRDAFAQSKKLTNKRTRKAAVAAKGLADVLSRQDRTAEADPYYVLAMSIDEELLGDGQASIEEEFYCIARHFFEEGKCELLESIFDDLLKRLRLSVGRNDPLVARCLNELGILYCSEQKWHQADSCFQRALAILEKQDPAPRRIMAALHNNRASVLEACEFSEEAKVEYETAMKLLQPVIAPSS